MNTYDLNVAIKFPPFWKVYYAFDKREKVNVVMTYEELAKIVDLLKKERTDEQQRMPWKKDIFRLNIEVFHKRRIDRFIASS